jgi:hypothetical protein
MQGIKARCKHQVMRAVQIAVRKIGAMQDGVHKCSGQYKSNSSYMKGNTTWISPKNGGCTGHYTTVMGVYLIEENTG